MARLISTLKRWKGKTLFWLRGKKLWMRLPPKQKRQSPPPRRRTSWDEFRTRVDPSHFSFSTSRWHEYEDNPKTGGKVVNPLAPIRSITPHTFLLDRAGEKRFALSYIEMGREISIDQIQRCRTQYNEKSSGWFEWDGKKETVASKSFQRQLGGMYPGEFLLCEFIFRQREKILKGTPVRWGWDKEEDYHPEKLNHYYISHYFKPVRGDRPSKLRLYELDLTKTRVKRILGIQ